MTPYPVLPDRPCGTCTTCCVALTIDDPALRKAQGYRCPNLTERQCGIYPQRPGKCREFECGWRMLKWVKPALRPDQSGVLITLQGTAEDGLGIAVMLVDRNAYKAEGLAETVAAAINAGLPVYLLIPGPPGHTNARARIDEVLAHAVATRDKAAITEFLRQARKQGGSGQTVPIRFRRSAAATGEREIPAGSDVQPPGSGGA